ncbi:MAG TPA: terminase small subunit [Anaerolineae bacterium]|nr:terminase small subunit [Anaerolineae bacterium]
MAETQLTDKQEAFVRFYIQNLNATESARLAGYDTDDYNTLKSIGCENMSKPAIRAEIDRRLRALLPSSEQIVARLDAIAFASVGPFIRKEDGLLDIHKLVDAGLGFLVTEIAPVRDGVRYRLADPLVALKLLARYRGLLSDQVDVKIHIDDTPSKDTLDSLVAQVMALEAQAAAEQ